MSAEIAAVTDPKRMVEYEAWIVAYVRDILHNDPAGQCRRAAVAMVAAFPELTLKLGIAHGKHDSAEHFWCETPSGEIVDPTASQYGPWPVERYEEVPWLAAPKP